MSDQDFHAAYARANSPGYPLTQDELDQIADGWPMDDDEPEDDERMNWLPPDNCEGQDDSEPQPCGLGECDCADYERRGGAH